MATQLYYNNTQIFAGQPTPMVEREDNMVRYGERWAEQTTITLNGQITGCIKDYSSLIAAQQRLIDLFSKDFQEFRVEENGNLVYSQPFSVVKGGITFGSSNYAGLVPYTITLESYPEDLFSGFYGVLEPRDSWSYQEQEDRKLLITHTVGARGFNTNGNISDAIDNAKAFVQSRTGMSPANYPTFIQIPSGVFPCLTRIRSIPNRMNGSYSLELQYEADLMGNSPGILRYTTEFDCDPLNGRSTVSVQGQYEGCFGSDIQDLRDRYNSFNIYEEALNTYQESTSYSDLNRDYLVSGVTEDPYKKTLNFNVQFDNFTGASVFLDYKVNINSGDNDITTVEFEGNIRSRGDIKTRWQRVSGYYQSGIDMFGLANNEYIAFGGIDPLNETPLTSGVTLNEYAGEISTKATWDNKEIPVDGFLNFTYSLSYTPALEKVVAKPLATNLYGPICADRWYVVDLGYKNRINFGINGNGKIKCGEQMDVALENLYDFANTTFSNQCPQTRVLLEQHQVTTGTNNISFSFNWSAESANNVVVPKSNYSSINNLAL